MGGSLVTPNYTYNSTQSALLTIALRWYNGIMDFGQHCFWYWLRAIRQQPLISPILTIPKLNA